MSDRLRVVKEASRHLFSAKIIIMGVVACAAYAVYKHPPVQSVGRQEVGVRLNRLTGSTTQLGEGLALVIPGVQDLRRYSLQDQTYT
ncbi:MAG: prohibitin family protein, partial [Dokdonella sp.]